MEFKQKAEVRKSFVRLEYTCLLAIKIKTEAKYHLVLTTTRIERAKAGAYELRNYKREMRMSIVFAGFHQDSRRTRKG